MIYLALAVCFIGVLCPLNLLLTLMLARRTRHLGERLDRRETMLDRHRGLAAGARVPTFTVPLASGGVFSQTDLNGSRAVIAFLAPGCGTCRAQIPELREYARTTLGRAAKVLAVVVCDDPDGAAEYARDLTGWASVTLEPSAGTLQKAFSVRGYPSFYSLSGDGMVEANGMTVRLLAAAARRR